MPTHPPFDPHVLKGTDVATLRKAVRLAAKAVGTTSEQERTHLASIVLSFYKHGLVDPRGLAEIAAFGSSSRAYRSQYSVTLRSHGPTRASDLD